MRLHVNNILLCEDAMSVLDQFTKEEVNIVLKTIENSKAAKSNRILPEFLKNLGPKGRTWLNKISNRYNKHLYFFKMIERC